jgi:fatty aldehyde-generating acyl-ACP reductase
MQRIGKVGFIGHPQDMDMFRGYIRHLKPDKVYRDGLLLKLFEWTPSYKVIEWNNLSFDGRRALDAILVMVPFLPEMRTMKLRTIVEKIEHALAICVEQGCSVAALGAFTSIILQGQEADLAAKYQLRITSGNALTAALIIESIEDLSRRFGISLPESSMAIIGASGDIGSACFAYFSEKVQQLRLSARGLSLLRDLVLHHEPTTKAKVTVTDDNLEAIGDARFVIFATSAPGHLVSLDDFRPGTVVCDASAPVNVRTGGLRRSDVFVYHGGVAGLPFQLDPGFDIGLASPTTFYGCQVEGLLIAMEPSLPDSWGRGRIANSTVQRYRDFLAGSAGVRVAYTEGSHNYTEQELDEYAVRFAPT